MAKFDNAGSLPGGPTVQTQGFQATAAQVESNGRQLQALGETLGNFFGNASKSVDQYAEVSHRERLAEIERENEALKLDAVVDAKSGKGMDETKSNRQDYYQVFQRTMADQQAEQLRPLLDERLEQARAEAARTGAVVDPAVVAQQFWKDHIGEGTGDRDYDSRLMYKFGELAERQVAHEQDVISKQINTKQRQDTLAGIVSGLQSKSFTLTNWKQAVADTMAVTQGDPAQAERLLLAAAKSGVYNAAQGERLLNVLLEDGLDKRDPRVFQEYSQIVEEQTNKVKGYDARNEVSSWHMDLANARSQYPQGILPPTEVLNFRERARRIDARHGVGADAFGIGNLFKAAVEKEVSVNYVKLAAEGRMNTNSFAGLTDAAGKNPATEFRKGYAPYIAEVAQNDPVMSKALNQSTGVIDIVSDPQVMARWVNLYATDANRQAFQWDTSEAYRSQIADTLASADPGKVQGMIPNLIQLRQHVGEDRFNNNFLSKEAANIAIPLMAVAEAGGDLTKATANLRDYLPLAKDLKEGYSEGKYGWGKIIGTPEEKPGQHQAAITKGLMDQVAVEMGVDRFLFANPAMGLPPTLERKIMATAVDVTLNLRGVNGGQPADPEKVAELVAKRWAGKLQAVPTANKTYGIGETPYPGRYESFADPMNGRDSPGYLNYPAGEWPPYLKGFSTTAKNAAGRNENTLETGKADLARLSETWKTDKFEGAEDLAIGRQTADGTYEVTNGAGVPLFFEVGGKTAVRKPDAAPVSPTGGRMRPTDVSGAWAAVTADSHEVATLPKDPVAAVKRVREIAGPGFYPVYDSATNRVYLKIAARFKTNAPEAVNQLAAEEKTHLDITADAKTRLDAVNRGMQLPGVPALPTYAP
jgi:hypothetical protein